MWLAIPRTWYYALHFHALTIMHNLHSPNRLFATGYGPVLQCECCDRIEIAFRDHSLKVDADELEALTETINHAWRTVQDAGGPDEWKLQAGTDGGPVGITLREASIRALQYQLPGGVVDARTARASKGSAARWGGDSVPCTARSRGRWSIPGGEVPMGRHDGVRSDAENSQTTCKFVSATYSS